jgi:hypothetical protein
VAEAPGGRRLHARIDYREFSVRWTWPSTSCRAAGRRGGRGGGRGAGAAARSEWFEDGEDARRRWEAPAGDAARLDAAGFRARYRLP